MKKTLLISLFSVLIGAVIISILYGAGKGIELDEGKVTYDELQEVIKDKENELNDITNELKENEDYYNELQRIEDKKEEIKKDVVEYEKDEISLETEIENKEEKLNKIDKKIIKIKDEPTKINPGVYYFGDDIEPGRYKLTYQEGYDGNVFFRGDNNFGETFGKGKYSIEEYTFYADEDDELEATIPINLYPVVE